MGTFSAVRTSLACERCGGAYPAEVQFKTGDDLAMPLYDIGQKVPALQPGSTFDGIADAFCAVCMKGWVADEKVANFEALADAVEAGEIIARFATYHAELNRLDLGPQLRVLRSEPLTPAEVRKLTSGPERVGWPTFPARLSEASVTLFRGDTPLVDSPGEWWSAHSQRVRARLSALGWRAPADDQFREIVVRIRADGTIGT
jgi:hypothetical protein